MPMKKDTESGTEDDIRCQVGRSWWHQIPILRSVTDGMSAVKLNQTRTIKGGMSNRYSVADLSNTLFVSCDADAAGL